MGKSYNPKASRYDNQDFYRQCGKWGLKLPAISLGCWHNFGKGVDHAKCVKMIHTAFDLGITHFDLANNYGPPPGSAETRFGRIIKDMPRNEMIISTKAGYYMWPGPYGDFGSRKYLIASLDESLKRMKLDYVDIFYHHRPDPNTPLEETMSALDTIVKQGKALYVGISSYTGQQTADAVRVCQENSFAPLLIHQPSYNMLNRNIEGDLLPVTEQHGLGVIAFCPLAQGLLTDKYLKRIPKDSRAASKTGFLKRESVTEQVVEKAARLNDIAKQRKQTLAQMALAWILRDWRITSALCGASRVQQIKDNVAATKNMQFSDDEYRAIEEILAS